MKKETFLKSVYFTEEEFLSKSVGTATPTIEAFIEWGEREYGVEKFEDIIRSEEKGYVPNYSTNPMEAYGHVQGIMNEPPVIKFMILKEIIPPPTVFSMAPSVPDWVRRMNGNSYDEGRFGATA